ncbi:MAG: primosomal protein N' [bacterium]|nr:primosomal protein N' [bacterium]
MIFADIIVDISHENIDKSYQYAVPEELEQEVEIGALVEIPFGKGNNKRKGYIVGLGTEAKFPVERMKPIYGLVKGSLVIESQLIALAYWIKDNYGATMNDALRTVIPIKKSVKTQEKRYIHLIIGLEEARAKLDEFLRKHNTARARLLGELMDQTTMDYETAIHKLKISRPTIADLQKMGIITVSSEVKYRNPVKNLKQEEFYLKLNEQQEEIASSIKGEFNMGIRRTYLIHGITGSGKTEVYMDIIAEVIKQKKQVIMLIPEIALTYQTVMRFYKRFGDRVSILNSRMSHGERFDQYTRAKNGEIDIMIGPRSALFTPFDNLGMIIIDEEHEGSYKSEMPPKYHAREVAIERARLTNASVVLGSATPSVDAYKKAMDGEYKLFELNARAGQGSLPTVYIADLREELKAHNKSIFSRKLKALMQDRLEKKEQIMLFINRRGYAGFVSCRACGHVMNCPHCDISLTSHTNGKLVCHYCGYEEYKPKNCPSCGSPYIAAFGTGTQKVEEYVHKEFPTARVLRMDTDTTSGKDGHEKILAAFANHQADILVGTQMIVKGHDFKDVTLVGVIAADLSLYASDYRAAERTFELLAQAAGRAGRGEKPGEVVIQTYNPDHYSVVAAAKNDYKEFYDQEISYRNMVKYPPCSNILAVLLTSKKEQVVVQASKLLGGAVSTQFAYLNEETEVLKVIGPAKANLSKVNDVFRYVIHLKCEDYDLLKQVKNYMEGFVQYSEYFKYCSVQYDFNPMNGY